jgi:hypothetical protein
MTIDQYIPPIPHTSLDIPRDTSQMVIAGPRSFRRASKKILSGKSKKNPFINFGGNRQNIAGELRYIWVADKGKKLINRDQGGADALVVSLLCRQGKYRELFQNNIKPHAYLALQTFQDEWKNTFGREKVEEAVVTPIKDLKNLSYWKQLLDTIKDSDNWEPKRRFYYFGKKLGHSGNYGMKGEKLASVVREETEGQIILSSGICDQWLYTYHGKLFPEIQRDFQFGVMNYAKKHKQLRNLFGWPYNLTGRDIDKLSQKDLNELYSWIPQSTVACITLMALVEMQEYIEDNNKDWDILQETHDSITMQAPDNEVEEAAVKLGEFMKRELVSPIDSYKTRMGSSCQIGLNWGKKLEDNPEGLEDVNL